MFFPVGSIIRRVKDEEAYSVHTGFSMRLFKAITERHEWARALTTHNIKNWHDQLSGKMSMVSNYINKYDIRYFEVMTDPKNPVYDKDTVLRVKGGPADGLFLVWTSCYISNEMDNFVLGYENMFDESLFTLE